MSDVYGTVTWEELGCPTEIGICEAPNGMRIRVSRPTIDAAAGDPGATFEVLRFGGLKPPQFMLGRRLD
jgi:hypothetical protein